MIGLGGRGMDTKDAFVAELDRRVAEATGKGYCCAQVVLSICLERMGVRDDVMLRSAVGLCGGGAGDACGALAGAAMILGLRLGPEKLGGPRSEGQKAALKALTETFAAYMGSTSCSAISKNDPHIKHTFCPSVMAGAVEIVRSMLLERGIDPDRKFSVR